MSQSNGGPDLTQTRAPSFCKIKANFSMPKFGLQAYGLATVMLGTMAFIPVYGVLALAKGYPKSPMLYVGLVRYYKISLAAKMQGAAHGRTTKDFCLFSGVGGLAS